MRYLLLVFISFFIIACGTDSPSEFKDLEENNSEIVINMNMNNVQNNTPPTTINNNVLNQLNNIRIASSLIPLSKNTELNNSAYNHAYYLNINHQVGHYESSSKQSFTGIKPVHRAIYSGYKSKMVSENLSVGQSSPYQSLKGLMSAIYHRFGFLDFDINTIGYGKENVSYVYNMGNSDLNNLCKGTSFNSNGTYYTNVCADPLFKIEASVYENELNKTINANPSYVIYPYNNEKNVTTSFYEESPDPLPTYDVSGYPISIEFNKNQYDMSNFSINSFIIYDDSNNVLDLAQDYNNSSLILSKANDINGYFSQYQFAIFPKNRLKYNTHYNVKFAYNYNGIPQNIVWGFTTEKLDNFIQYNNTDLNLNTNTKYNIYIPPLHKNNIYNRFSISCVYLSSNSAPSYEIDFYDKNTITLKISGENITSCSIQLKK